MESSSGKKEDNNYRNYRFIPLASYSPSYLMNNLSSNDGESFVFANTSESGQPKAIIHSKEMLDGKGETSSPQVFQWKDQSECFCIKYVKAQDTWYLIICTAKSCQIYNHNATRQLVTVESKKKMGDGKINFFTSASKGIEKGSGQEFIAVGTSSGEVHSVMINGGSFAKDLGFQMVD